MAMEVVEYGLLWNQIHGHWCFDIFSMQGFFLVGYIE
jgi:hypothetical protein